jgi:hypothetical protein
MNDRRAAAVLAAIVTLLFADVLFLGNNFWFRDLFVYHFPMKLIIRDAILRGEFPWWNPYFGGGQPLAANPAYEIFYPPQWLIFIGPYRFGFALHIMIHVYIALLGAYAFFRSVPLRIDASMFGALSFAFSGFLLGTMTNLPTFFVWSWAGVVGWGVLRLIRGGPIGPVAVAMAMPILVFEPVSLVQLFALVIAGTLFMNWRELPRVIGAMILAAVISAVVILPAFDHTRDSIRSRGFPYDEASTYSMPPLRPLELVMPRVLGVFDGDVRAFWGYFYDGKRVTPYLLSLYCGGAVAILAIAGWILRRRGSLVVAASCVVSYFVAIGGNTPLYRWLYDAGMHSIRYPEKFIATALVTLIIFAAFVANDLDEEKLRRVGLVTAAAISIALLAAVIVITVPVFLRMWDLPPQAAELAAMFRRRTLFTAVITALWAVVIWRSRSGRVWTIAALALLLFDVARFSDKLLPRMPKSFFTPPPIANAFDRDRANYAVFPRGEWTQQRVAVANEGAALAWFARNGLRPYSPALWRLRTSLELDFDETDLLPTHELLARMKRYGESGAANWGDPFMAVANVRYVYDFRPPAQALAEAPAGPATWQPLSLHRVPSQGRFWFATRLLPASQLEHAHLGDACGAFPIAAPAAGRILAVNETANSADLDVQADGSALLVVTITMHKYWQALIDGRPAVLLPANIAYQSVVVPPGRHRIALRYRNPLIAWSAAISAAGLLVAIAPRRPRRRLRSAP